MSMPSFSGYGKGKQVPLMTPEQSEHMKQGFGSLGPDFQKALQRMSRIASGSPETFEEMEAPALRQFGALQGNIASRFSGAGGLGTRKSSGFGNTMNTAAQTLAESLQSQRHELSAQALRDLMGYSSNLLGQRSFENVYQQKKAKPWETFMQTILGLGGKALPFFL